MPQTTKNITAMANAIRVLVLRFTGQVVQLF